MTVYLVLHEIEIEMLNAIAGLQDAPQLRPGNGLTVAASQVEGANARKLLGMLKYLAKAANKGTGLDCRE